MSTDSAFATFLADTRDGRCTWSPWLVERFGGDAHRATLSWN